MVSERGVSTPELESACHELVEYQDMLDCEIEKGLIPAHYCIMAKERIDDLLVKVDHYLFTGETGIEIPKDTTKAMIEWSKLLYARGLEDRAHSLRDSIDLMLKGLLQRVGSY